MGEGEGARRERGREVRVVKKTGRGSDPVVMGPLIQFQMTMMLPLLLLMLLVLKLTLELELSAPLYLLPDSLMPKLSGLRPEAVVRAVLS